MQPDLTEKILELEEKGTPTEQILPLIAGERVRSAYETGETANAMVTAGQTVGLIHEILSVDEIITRIISQAENIIEKLNRIEKS